MIFEMEYHPRVKTDLIGGSSLCVTTLWWLPTVFDCGAPLHEECAGLNCYNQQQCPYLTLKCSLTNN